MATKNEELYVRHITGGIPGIEFGIPGIEFGIPGIELLF
jgi:hypothetical protein